MWSRLLRPFYTTPGLLFVFFACLYVFTYRGQTWSYDGDSMYATTRALATQGSLAIGHWGPSTPGRDGLLYSKYGIGQSLVELPGFFLGTLAEAILHPHALSIARMLALAINPLLMALACVLFYGIARTLTFPRRTALMATLVLGVATSLWPYAKTDFAEPLLTASLAGAVFCALVVAKKVVAGGERGAGDVARWALLAGVGLGTGILAKYAAFAYVPVVCVYLTAVAWRRQSLQQWIKMQVALLIPVAAGGGIVLLVNFLRFGSPLITGYTSGDHPFTTAIWDGTYGLLFGPYRSLLFYDPLLFMGLLCLPIFFRKRWREALLPVGFLLVSLVIYGTYAPWDGGSSWGPRYLVPILPYFLWPLMNLGWFGPQNADEMPKRRLPVMGRSALILLIGGSIAIQLIGVIVNYSIYDVYWHGVVTVLPSYKNALSTSPLLTDLWLLPMSLYFAFTARVPHLGFAPANYPFGPPLPTNPHMPMMLDPYALDYFWFTQLPHHAVWSIAGLLVFGGGMALAGWRLLRRMREGSSRGYPHQPIESAEIGPRIPAAASGREDRYGDTMRRL